MSEPGSYDPIPEIGEILGEWRQELGADAVAYTNHVCRVVKFCIEIHRADEDDREKIVIAGCFHDLGIWAHNTFDYLRPSIEMAKTYLEDHGKPDWAEEIELMIDLHHKLTPYRDPEFPLVESFRKADLVDVSKGMMKCGLPRKFVKEVLAQFPNAGFHRRLVQLTFAEFKKHPLRPLPMMKW